MTKDDDGMARGDGEQLGTAELRRMLTGQLGYALPADLVITTRAEIETREFTAYGQGWRDHVEHAAHRAKAARTAGDQEGKILPFPHQRQPSPTSTGDPTRNSTGHSVPPGDEPS